ncbi:MAG: Jag N-terminal domain-containing protein [Candidatus Cloacimonetes bacterium]|nr:Jag N-terminal domain-containing protein [Candidatus Cloacimonadota bacterium]
MMRERIHSAETVEIAKQQLMEQIRLRDYETCEFEVVQEERKGILGIGSREAQVKVKIDADKHKKAMTLLKEALEIMNIKVDIKDKFNKKSNSLDIELEGEEADELFATLGQDREDLEQLLNLMVNARTESRFLKIHLQQPLKRNPAREQFLKNQAITLARQVVQSGQSISLPSMNSYERSLVHNAVKEVDGVMTQSEGTGPDRHVVIHKTGN